MEYFITCMKQSRIYHKLVKSFKNLKSIIRDNDPPFILIR